jgi:hypothetical protein
MEKKKTDIPAANGEMPVEEAQEAGFLNSLIPG